MVRIRRGVILGTCDNGRTAGCVGFFAKNVEGGRHAKLLLGVGQGFLPFFPRSVSTGTFMTDIVVFKSEAQ